VFDIRNKEKIDFEDIKTLQFENRKRVIFKPINSTCWKLPEFKKDLFILPSAA